MYVAFYSMELNNTSFGNQTCIQSITPPTNISLTLMELLKFLIGAQPCPYSWGYGGRGEQSRQGCVACKNENITI